MIDESESATELAEVVSAARRLPICDGAAKLHALVGRLLDALHEGTNPRAAVDALATAASHALEDDPWVQFETAVRRYQARCASGGASSGVTAAQSTTSATLT